MVRKFLAAALVSLAALAQTASAQDIKVGVLSDLSGPTSSVGVPYAKGIMDCLNWVNAQGGVAGRKIAPTQVDYAYDVNRALTAYKRFVGDNVAAIQGWGTADTEALTKFVAKDQIPTLSASYSAHLTDPAKAPYNFFVSTDYSTQLRAALKYLKDNFKEARAPKLAFIFPDHPYGLAPIPAAREYAKELGFEIVGEENVDLKAIDAVTQLLSLQKKEPDFCWIGGTTPSTAVIFKDAKKLGMKTVFFANIWGVDETTFGLAGAAAAGNLSLQAGVTYKDEAPGAKLIREITKNEPQMTHYIRGFASALTMVEAFKIAAGKGKVDGPAVKAALETLRDYDPMGLTPPISFFPNDHRPSMTVKLYKLSDSKMEPLAVQTLDRKAEWLGK